MECLLEYGIPFLLSTLVSSCLSQQPGLIILLSYGVSLFPPRLINQKCLWFMSSYDVYSNVLMRFCAMIELV